MSTPSLARRERHDLCDLALALGEDAPTLCGEWVAKDLVAHLLVREHRPLGAAGITVPLLAGLTDREMARMTRKDFAVLVEKLRDPGLTPYALPGLEQLLNTVEYFVHHEDLPRVPVRVRRSDTGASATLHRGDEPVVVTGLPCELVLFLVGRDRVHGLELDGPADRVATLRNADLGI